MNNTIRRIALAAGLLLILPALLAACGDSGLSRAEVEEIVQEEVASQSQADSSSQMAPDDVEGIVNDAIEKMTPPEPGLTSAQVEEAVRSAISAMPQPEPGLTRAEVEEMVRAAIASIPSRSRPRRLHAILRRQRHRPLRGPGPGRHPRPLQQPPERRRPVVRLHHRPERPGHRTPRSRTPGPGPEWLGGHRRQRLRVRAGDALRHRGRQVGVLRLPQP